MTKISEHITLEEATQSPTALRHGLTNQPNEVELSAMKLVAEKCFEPLRKWYDKPIKINSFFRCVKLNEIVKGSPTSEHVKGMAIDMSTGSKEENEKLFNWCNENLKFTQLINEYGFQWVHISYNPANLKQQIFVIK